MLFMQPLEKKKKEFIGTNLFFMLTITYFRIAYLEGNSRFFTFSKILINYKLYVQKIKVINKTNKTNKIKKK